MDDLKKMAEQAVDLAEVSKSALEDAAAESRLQEAMAEQQRAEYERARRWHRSMRRAFKGIYPDRLRLANLARYGQENQDA